MKKGEVLETYSLDNVQNLFSRLRQELKSLHWVDLEQVFSLVGFCMV
jgi:hypothetical protein